MKVKKCERCGKEIVVRSSKTKYCPECAAIAKRESQKKWYQNNRQSEMARARRYYRVRTEKMNEDDQRRLAEEKLIKETLEREKIEIEKAEAEIEEKKVKRKYRVVPALSIDEVLRRAKGTGLSYGQYVSKMEREATA